MCVCVDRDKIKLDDADFYEDNPETIIYVRLLAWHDKFEKCKSYKKDISKELMPVVSSYKTVRLTQARRRKKEIEPIFIDKVGKRLDIVQNHYEFCQFF